MSPGDRVDRIMAQWEAGAADPAPSHAPLPSGALAGICVRCGSGLGKCFCGQPLKPQAWPVPVLYGQPDGWPIVVWEMMDADGKPLYELDPGDRYDGPQGIIAAMNERAEFELWKTIQEFKQLEDVWGPYRPGIWRGQPNPRSVRKDCSK